MAGMPTTGGAARSIRRVVLRVSVTTVGLAAGMTLLLTAFVWPTVASAPKDVPLAVAPAAAVGQVAAGLTHAAPPGAVTLVPVADRAAALSAIRDRTVYGAIVLGDAGPQVYAAGAASPVVAQMLDGMARGIAATASGSPVVAATDVVPSPVGDPHGAGFAIGAIPMTIAGLVTGALVGIVVRRRLARLVTLVLAASFTGLAFGWVLHLLGVLSGGYPAEAGVIALAIAGVAAPTCGAVAWLGARGVAPVAIVMVLLGIPLSGAASAPEFLPAFWGGLGQWLPSGAGVTLLRTVAFFPAAPLSGALWILLGWSLIGAAAVLLARPKRMGTSATASPKTAAPQSI